MNQAKSVSLNQRLLFCAAAVFLWTGKVLALNATDTVQAESFSGQSGGITTETCKEGGQDVSSIQNGRYIYFDNVDFGSTGIQCFEARIASGGPAAYPGCFIEVHLDSPTGTLVGTCEIEPETGGWQIWVSKACSITGATGVHTLYLVFTGATGNLFSLNWFKFHGTPSITSVGWRSSNGTTNGKWNGTVTLSTASGTPTIQMYPDTQYQRVDGWGGAFNDVGAASIDSLSTGLRSAVMRELFDPVNGCKFNIGRVPIGISDFSLVAGYYSLDETSGDYSMTKFSIHHDSLYNIPYIKEAMKWQPNMMIYGSVWTPPTWMKTPVSWQGPAQFNQDAQTLTAYALYFRKFVQAWQQAGISVFVVYPQNEPGWNVAGQPACGWTGTQMKDFARNYLCPDFNANGIGAQVWMGNFFTNNFANDVLPTLQDTVACKLVRGAGIHRVAYPTMEQAMDTANAHNLHWHGMQDETMCWSGANSWADAMNTESYIDSFFASKTNSYMFWNMILNTNTNFGWQSRAQNSMITINTASNPKVVRYTGEFYVMKHWSYYIAQGAVNIKVTNTNANLAACGFKNPDGSIILELQNLGLALSPLIQVGSQAFSPALSASSVNTFILGGNPDTHDWVPVTAVQYDPPPKRIVAGLKGTWGVYDIKGRLIKLLDKQSKANASGMVWDRTDASGGKATPGLYFIADRATGGNAVVRKVMCR